jgi:hypothetical protein
LYEELVFPSFTWSISHILVTFYNEWTNLSILWWAGGVTAHDAMHITLHTHLNNGSHLCSIPVPCPVTTTLHGLWHH